MKLTEEIISAIRKLQSDYPEKRSALLPALHLVQSQFGYLPLDIQAEVAGLFDIEPNEVNAVVTFYDMFFDAPAGKHLVHVCKNASCMLSGSDCILKALCDKLCVEPYGTTEDGEFTVIPSECLAACDRAPMMLVDEKVVGPVTEEMLDGILLEAKKGKGHPSPVTLDEVEHA